MIRLWIEVHNYDSTIGHSGRDTLWWRDMETDYVPTMEGQVHLLRDPDDGHNWLLASPKRIYWDFDGQVNIEFVPYQMDPPESMRAHVDGRYRSAWWTDQDGDLNDHLRASGWTSHSEKKPR